jgi:predicted esterase
MKSHEMAATLRFGASLAESRSAVILLHGRGSSPRDIAGLADTLPGTDIAFLAPGATNGTWYPQRFFAPLERNEPYLSDALGVIDHLVSEIHDSGLSSERIGLIGFSQGGCLALEYAARHPRRYGFVAGLSGALIGPLDSPRAAADLRGTPVLVGCAAGDLHIPRDYVEQSAETLSRLGATVTKQIFRGDDHTVFPEEINWLSQQIAAWEKAA